MLDWLLNALGGGGSQNVANTQATIGPNFMSHLSPDTWGTQIPVPSTTQKSEPSALGGFFENPAFQSFLAQVGASLDPEGFGGAVGKAVTQQIQSKQTAKIAEKQDKRWDALIAALGKQETGQNSQPGAMLGGNSSMGTLGTLSSLGSLGQKSPDQAASLDDVLQKTYAQFSELLQKFGAIANRL